MARLFHAPHARPLCASHIEVDTKWTPFSSRHFKCIFLNTMYEYRLKFHWNLFLRFQLTIFQHWFRQWLGAGQLGDKTLCEPMMVSLMTHICVTRPQLVNSLLGDAIWRHKSGSTLFQVMPRLTAPSDYLNRYIDLPPKTLCDTHRKTVSPGVLANLIFVACVWSLHV